MSKSTTNTVHKNVNASYSLTVQDVSIWHGYISAPHDISISVYVCV